MDPISEIIIRGIVVAHSRTGITLAEIEKKYYECIGDPWLLGKRSKLFTIDYLEKVPCLSSFQNEKNEIIWYVRGKPLDKKTCGKICRPRREKIKYQTNEKPRVGSTNTYLPNKKFSNNENASSNLRFFRDGNETSETSEPKTDAALFNYDLLGDDFFLHLVKIDLKCQPMQRDGILRCGLCVSGQRIKDATERISRYSDTENMRLIVNIGSVDILNGQQFSDMCNDFINLVKLCERRQIHLVITTLAPLANVLHSTDDVKKLNDFNSFLMSKFSAKHQVIDITDCMKCRKTNKVWFDCYQPKAKYMSGSSKPQVLWNRIGRQRILKHIKSYLTL